MGALERTCVQTEPPKFRLPLLPTKGKKVAVAGSGLSSLTAAWDLVRKGYRVTLFDAKDIPGASLHQPDPFYLPPEAIDAEITTLMGLGIQFKLRQNPDSKEFAKSCRNDFDAIYLGLDDISGQGWNLKRDERGAICIEAGTYSTSCNEIFAAGRISSPVWQAAQGRWAATSIDRFLQRVSMTAGREKEGSVKTRLYTSLKDVVFLPAVSASDEKKGYSQTEAETEAQRCLQCECLECVKVCSYMEKFGAYPKKYAREVYNNLSIVMGEHKANKLINSCSLCGLCRQICPNDFSMQDLNLLARRTMVESGKMPPSAHEFALLDMSFSQSKHFAMARHQPDQARSKHLFFPGCQLCASAPGQVELVYAHLRSVLSDGVGLMLDCCAAPAFWAGRKESFEGQSAHLTAQWETLGRPCLILACPTCLRMFKDHLPVIPTVALWSVLETHPRPGTAIEISRPLTVHDSCTVRNETELQACVRRLLIKVGVSIEEMTLEQDKTECCGFGGLMQNANPELAREVVRQRAGRASVDYVAYCAMCRDNLAAVGKRVVHLLDIFFPDPKQSDSAARPRPDWSQRQENRARLKVRLLERVWNEVPMKMNNRETIELLISPEVAQRLDRRRILIEDLKQVIQQAEASGDRLFHPPSGHYKAAHTPYKVTFWVEYTPTSKGYVVHNAYAHRMEVIGP
jgi:Fe-S oxidoreductase